MSKISKNLEEEAHGIKYPQWIKFLFWVDHGLFRGKWKWLCEKCDNIEWSYRKK